MHRITPPLGTPMFGFGGRDRDPLGCQTVNDDLMVRALYLEQASTRCLILGFDLLFFSRAEADRLKGMLSRVFDFTAREIVLNCSHTHAGPQVGDWGGGEPDTLYMDWLQSAVAAAVEAAVKTAQAVDLKAGRGTTRLPVSRRYRRPDGIAAWRPAPDGEVYRHVPFCRFDTPDGKPVGLLFSVACHPSTIGGLVISADYPGSACRRLDAALGTPAAVFVQGCGGDSKACVIADGGPDDDGLAAWRQGTPEDVERAGQIVAEDVLAALDGGRPVDLLPDGMVCRLDALAHPLEAPPDREYLVAMSKHEHPARRAWAERQLAWLTAEIPLPRTAPILCQTVHLASGLRLVALEGEPVAGYGHLIDGMYPDDLVFPLGYSNGQGMYLPADRMYPEKGYEVVSAYEYGFPAPAAPGFEERLRTLLRNR